MMLVTARLQFYVSKLLRSLKSAPAKPLFVAPMADAKGNQLAVQVTLLAVTLQAL